MYFASDNSGPALPQVMQALNDANRGYAMGYGADQLMADVRTQICDIFEAPDAAVYLVATGTAANALALATLAQPWQTIFCAPVAHIHEDECNAPEFYTGGTKLTLVGETDKISVEALRAAIEAEETRGVHGPQRGPVSLTQVTERGTVYTLGEIKALSSLAANYNLPVHMDGARFANALEALECTPAELTWKAGVDVVSFGATKNGCLGVEAVIFFDDKHTWEFELRRKRGAHLFSKHRYLSAQMQAYLLGDLWRKTARKANQKAARLTTGLKEIPHVSFAHPPQANMVFATMPRAMHKNLLDAGVVYNIWSGNLDGSDPNEPLTARFVCDWSLSDANIDRFLEIVRNS